MVGRVKKRISLGILATVLAIVLVGAAVWYNVGFRQRANVVTGAMITVYTDSEMTQELGQYLDWPDLSTSPETYTMDLWINNTGSVDVVLQFNYNGEQMPGDWTETWDYNDAPLTVGNNVMVTITLELPENVGVGHYEWDAGISATEYIAP